MLDGQYRKLMSATTSEILDIFFISGLVLLAANLHFSSMHTHAPRNRQLKSKVFVINNGEVTFIVVDNVHRLSFKT